jgi:hypothetical protein
MFLSVVSLLQYVVLVEIYRENSSLVRKGRSIFTAFSDNFLYIFVTAPKLEKR